LGKPSDSNLLTLLSSGLLNEVTDTNIRLTLSLPGLLKSIKPQNTSAWLQVKYRARVLCVGGVGGFRAINIKFGWMGPRLSRVVATGNLEVFQMLYKIFSFFNARFMCIDSLLLRVSTAPPPR